MEERRRLSDDLVGVPRWGRWLVYGITGFMVIFTALAAVLYLPYFGYRMLGGVAGLIGVVAFEAAVIALVIGLRWSRRVRLWYTGNEDGVTKPDLRKHRHWDRFMP